MIGVAAEESRVPHRLGAATSAALTLLSRPTTPCDTGLSFGDTSRIGVVVRFDGPVAPPEARPEVQPIADPVEAFYWPRFPPFPLG